MIKSKLNLESGKRLRKVIEKKGITQIQLADLAGFSQQYINYIITGKKAMSVNAAETFSNCLNIRQEYLLCEDDFETWEELERTKNKVANDECQIAINYLRTLGVSIIPLMILPTSIPEDKNELIGSFEVYDSCIVNSKGETSKLIKVPQFAKFLYKDTDSIAFKLAASLKIAFVAIETADSCTILSLKEFAFFLNNIDDFVKFSINNFFSNHSYIKDIYTPESIKDILDKDTEEL